MNLKFVEKAENADDIISMAKKLKSKADWVEQEIIKAQLRLDKRLKYPILNSKENAQIKYIEDLQDISADINKQKQSKERSKTLKYTAGAVGLGLLGNEYIKSKTKMTKQASKLSTVVKDIKRVSKFFNGKNTLIAEESLKKAKSGLFKAREELENISKVSPEYQKAVEAVDKQLSRHSKALNLVKDVRKKSKRAVYSGIAGLGAVGIGAGVYNS